MTKCKASVRLFLLRGARVGALLLTLQLIALCALVGAARAQAGEALLSVGQEVMRYVHADRQDERRSIRINGLLLRMSVGSTKRSIDEVLEFFEGRCHDRSGVPWGLVSDAGAWLQPEVDESPHIVFDPVIRDESDGRGFVGCLDVGEERLDPWVLLARVGRFFESGDLADVGDLRFVLATPGERRTVFVTVWSDGPMRLYEAFPSEGDAPGWDVAGVPRPAAARRVLTATEEGERPQLVAYVHDEASTDGGAEHLNDLHQAGWERLDSGARGSGEDRAELFERGGRLVMVARLNDASVGAITAVAELGVSHTLDGLSQKSARSRSNLRNHP